MSDNQVSQKWTEIQLKLAFYLYCQLPFGKLHAKNPDVIKMAKIIGRTQNALAMKLVNFASLDPAITDSGRKGLGNASNADHEIWEKFHANWELLTEECEGLLENKADDNIEKQDDIGYSGETRQSIVNTRIGQSFFRKSVLSSYQYICCMSGVSIPELLIASHIIPWSNSKENRLNPANGLCLSSIHDKAFDLGLITVNPDCVIIVSKKMKEYKNNVPQTELLLALDGKSIILPEKFHPDKDFLL
ncbi:restriction endonuclease [Spirochaetia bacterium]|nr:restriction endonuclease [Spirochaetia bacterium]